MEPTGYTSLQERKSTGAHYTPSLLADFVAKQIVSVWSKYSNNQKSIRVLDPASGDGELLLALLQNLNQVDKANIFAQGFDTDLSAVKLASSRINSLFQKITLNIDYANFLEFVLLHGNKDLFGLPENRLFDLVIANPPYVRTQVLGAFEAQKLAKQFGLSGRVDLYYPFILGIARILRPGGIAGIIVSNRFMTTKAGSSVRKAILEKFDVLHVWDLGDTRLFEAAVLPAVLLVRKKGANLSQVNSNFTSIYSTKNSKSPRHCSNVIEALDENDEGIFEVGDVGQFKVQKGRLNHGDSLNGVWRIANGELDEWLSIVDDNTFCRFADIGKVRVGVKTTADKVFIKADWNKIPKEDQPELLRPLITHHIAHPYKASQPTPKRKILYTHEVVNGKRKAIEIEKYPKSAKYLFQHRSTLEKRKYVTKAGRNWFEIWVPQDPEAWALPKLVFRDITETPTFWLDLSGSIVNGDCYWIVCDDQKEQDLLWLALAVGNSSFIKAFYDKKFHNKLYAGRRRFMTQYSEQFPIPDPEKKLSKKIVSITKEIYECLPDQDTKRLELNLDELIWQAFGLPVEKVAG